MKKELLSRYTKISEVSEVLTGNRTAIRTDGRSAKKHENEHKKALKDIEMFWAKWEKKYLY